MNLQARSQWDRASLLRNPETHFRGRRRSTLGACSFWTRVDSQDAVSIVRGTYPADQ